MRDRGVRAFSVHPGAIFTELLRYAPSETLRQHGIIDAQGAAIIDPANDRKSVAQGAATQVWGAVSPQLDGMGGVYCEDCDIARPCPADSPLQRGVKPWAADLQLADRLWALSEGLAGR